MAKVPVRIEVAAGDAKIFSGYDPTLVDLIREVAGREWHADGQCSCAFIGKRKHWMVPESEVNGLVADLKAAGFAPTVQQRQASTADPSAWDAERRKLTDEIAHLRRQLAIGAGSSSRGQTWADELLAKCGSTEQADKVYRALTRVLHPDVGGSTALMQEFNVARDKRGGRR